MNGSLPPKFANTNARLKQGQQNENQLHKPQTDTNSSSCHDFKCHSINCSWPSMLNAQPRCCPELSKAASTELNVMMSALSPSSVNQSNASCHWLPLAHAPQMISGNMNDVFEILNLMCRVCHICSVLMSTRQWHCEVKMLMDALYVTTVACRVSSWRVPSSQSECCHSSPRNIWKHIITKGKHHEEANQLLQHSIQLSKIIHTWLSQLLNAWQGTLCTGTHHCIAGNDIELQLFLLQRFEEKKGNLPLTWFLTGAYGCTVRNNIALQASLIFQVSQQPNCRFPSGSLSTCMNCWVVGHRCCLQTLELQLIEQLQSYLPVFAFGTLWDCFVEINDTIATIGLQSRDVFRFTCHA